MVGFRLLRWATMELPEGYLWDNVRCMDKSNALGNHPSHILMGLEQTSSSSFLYVSIGVYTITVFGRIKIFTLAFSCANLLLATNSSLLKCFCKLMHFSKCFFIIILNTILCKVMCKSDISNTKTSSCLGWETSTFTI